MNHQPFKDWLIADPTEEPLTPEQRTALQGHLQGCESCRLLSTAWQAAESRLKQAPTLAPEPGFASRWHRRLQADRQRLHRRQSLALLSFSLAGAALLLGSLAILAYPLLESPSLLFWTWLYRLMTMISYAGTAQDIFAGIFNTATVKLSWIWWVITAGVLTELAVLWIVSYRLLTNPRRITQ
jgi:hypothetical protein